MLHLSLPGTEEGVVSPNGFWSAWSWSQRIKRAFYAHLSKLYFQWVRDQVLKRKEKRKRKITNPHKLSRATRAFVQKNLCSCSLIQK